MNIWHDLNPSRVTCQKFDAVIEISKGGKAKYELDKPTGMLRLDRVLYTSTVYPANYGFIPRTLSPDGDPLDVLVLSGEPILPMTIVTCAPIGVIKMRDGGEEDEKIIAVALGDPTYKNFKSVDELPSHVFLETSHFFEVYKTLENKITAVETMLGREQAKKTIAAAISLYSQKFGQT